MGGESNALTASTTSDKVQQKSGDPVKLSKPLCVPPSLETFSLNLRSPLHHDWRVAGLRWLRAGVRAPLLTLLLSFNGNKWVSAMRMQRDCMKICGWLIICNWLVSWSSFPPTAQVNVSACHCGFNHQTVDNSSDTTFCFYIFLCECRKNLSMANKQNNNNLLN